MIKLYVRINIYKFYIAYWKYFKNNDVLLEKLIIFSKFYI